MYINIHKDKQCSSCGAINQTEIVERGNNYFVPYCVETFIRCTRCGHEKQIYTTTSASTGGPVMYQIEGTDTKEKF